jgi:murein DD-endopeptidase MepM/ murein hydrolase activator NlpD
MALGSKRTIYIRDYRQKRGSRLARFGAAVLIVGLIVLNYMVFLKDSIRYQPPLEEKRLKELPKMEDPRKFQAIEPAVPVELPNEEPATTVAGELRSGESVLQAMKSLGVQADEAIPAIQAMEDVFDFRSAQAGDRFRIQLDRVGKVVEFEFATSPTDVYVVKRENGRLAALKKNIPTDVKLVSMGCVVQGSLYSSFTRCGGDGKLARLFMDLFVWDFNFFQQARKGDTFKLLVEKVYVDGRFLDYGRILAAQYSGQAVGEHSVFYFKDAEGVDGYYTTDGTAVRKEFVKTPLDYGAGTSEEMAARFKPRLVKKTKTRFMEYPAPPGAEVWSVAAGTVTFAGEVKGEGWVVEVQHAGGYNSRYAKLDKLAQGIEKGSQVFQKSALGRVSPRSGKFPPVLQFSLTKGRRFLNHMEENFPGGESIPAASKRLFEETVNKYLDELKTLDVIGVEDSQA